MPVHAWMCGASLLFPRSLVGFLPTAVIAESLTSGYWSDWLFSVPSLSSLCASGTLHSHPWATTLQVRTWDVSGAQQREYGIFHLESPESRVGSQMAFLACGTSCHRGS